MCFDASKFLKKRYKRNMVSLKYLSIPNNWLKMHGYPMRRKSP